MPKKDEIIKRLIANCAEIITEEEFKERLNSNKKLTHYIGFEISGYVHIGQGIMSALVMKDLTDLGAHCTIWLADWHTAINEKLDDTKETAARIGTNRGSARRDRDRPRAVNVVRIAKDYLCRSAPAPGRP